MIMMFRLSVREKILVSSVDGVSATYPIPVVFKYRKAIAMKFILKLLATKFKRTFVVQSTTTYNSQQSHTTYCTIQL